MGQWEVGTGVVGAGAVGAGHLEWWWQREPAVETGVVGTRAALGTRAVGAGTTAEGIGKLEPQEWELGQSEPW
jgi:hypothetical protein